MSKHFSRSLILVTACLILGQLTHTAAAQEDKKKADEPEKPAAKAEEKSIFPDKKLEGAVRQYVFEKRGTDKPLTAEDVKSISIIDARDQGISDLSGLEKCVSLASLDLRGNKVEDIAVLKGLDRVQMLILADNEVADITPLAGIEGLQYLDLSGNRVSDIAALSKLTKLNTLYLAGNRIEDLSPLSNHDRLWSLYLDGNPIKSLEPIGSCTRLSTLSVKQTGISAADLKALAGLTELKFLFLEGNKIKDLSPLVEMAKKDAAGDRRFSPYWQIYLEGNPLGAKTNAQIAELKKLGARLETK